jgi:hypothetical protein
MNGSWVPEVKVKYFKETDTAVVERIDAPVEETMEMIRVHELIHAQLTFGAVGGSNPKPERRQRTRFCEPDQDAGLIRAARSSRTYPSSTASSRCLEARRDEVRRIR